MATVNVCLTFNGNRKEAFDFCRSVFDGGFSYVEEPYQEAKEQ